MSFLRRLKQRHNERVERRRNEAIEKALGRGATPEQAQRAGDRAARRYTNAAITSSINSG
jgi:hypothetical protein